MTTIVIASGKGGTGKTTIASLFAVLAAQTQQIVVVDADVEASNLPIAMGVDAERCEPFPGQGRVTIDPDICCGCSACEHMCRFGALAFDMDKGSFVVDPWACERCGFCAYVCPWDAVRTVATVNGEACVGYAPMGAMAFGHLEPGEDLSGRLVTEVRHLGSTEALAAGAALVLVDGPPGIGCPVVASIADTDLIVAVAEPTVSGEHDLIRIAELARRFGLPVRVVLNKSDLSPTGAERIREACLAHGLSVIAEIPYDPALASLAMTPASQLPEGSSALVEVMRAWSSLETDISAIRARSTDSAQMRAR